MISNFIIQAWGNGSGISINYGPLQIEWICTPPSGSDNNYFREVSSIAPGCGASYPLGNTTVAYSKSNANITCGDQLLIVGLGSGVGTVKEATDYCGVCSAAQLDNYNTGAACSASAFANLGNLPTIRINR
jgi:hypothetical protein